MIDLENKILFVHIPKCAGTFIEHNLTPDIDWHQLGEKHYSMQKCIEVYGESDVSSCFRFSVIRNPFSRLLSFFLYHKRHGSELFAVNAFEKRTRAFKSDYYQNFSDFVFNLKHYFHKLEAWAQNDILPCHDFLTSHQGIGVDMVLKQENLAQELVALTEKTGINFHNEKINSSPNKYSNSDYYGEAEIAFVLAFYKADFHHYYPNFQLDN
ncbi:sulfotransferase family 2 domain-containing protein [Thalassotalea sp. PLHSN55]|uniref:sulfotransferase family 2 domain-containing protein n=1 Tax=Thalassotalea sp. PLHSN55 TaxID=3435888 RepID=UPI003F8370D5